MQSANWAGSIFLLGPGNPSQEGVDLLLQEFVFQPQVHDVLLAGGERSAQFSFQLSRRDWFMKFASATGQIRIKWDLGGLCAKLSRH